MGKCEYGLGTEDIIELLILLDVLMVACLERCVGVFILGRYKLKNIEVKYCGIGITFSNGSAKKVCF